MNIFFSINLTTFKYFEFLYPSLHLHFLAHTLYPIFIYVIVAFILSLVIIGLSYLLSNQIRDVEKLSAYECGFEPYSDSRKKFDVKFYLVAILFLVFDIETVFLFPWAVCFNVLDTLSFWVVIDFILELGIGYIFIWYTNALNW